MLVTITIILGIHGYGKPDCKSISRRELRRIWLDGRTITELVRIYLTTIFFLFKTIVIFSMVFGREVITKYTTQLKTNSTFFTDSNGREMLKRIRNFRPTWNVQIEEPEAANYYPVTSKITIKDEEQNIQFSVLTDRAQGGSSLNDGEIELMVKVCTHFSIHYTLWDYRFIGIPKRTTD